MEIYVLIILFVLAVVCLHLNSIIKDKRDFDTVIRIALIFLLIHAGVAFIGKLFLKQYLYIDWVGTFGLVYGPLLYIGYLASRRCLPEKKQIGIHLLPFLVAITCYIVYLLLPSGLQQSVQFKYSSILYGTMACSWLVYAAWVIYLASRKPEMISAGFKSLLSAGGIILFALVVFIAIMVYTQSIQGVKSTAITTVLVTCLGMLGGIVLIYQYTFRRFKGSHANMEDRPRSVFPKEETDAQKLEYQKSALKEEVMVAYSEKVNDFIESGAYLDIDLSLGKIAAKLKIPKHHLSQLFSQHYKQGFLEYINTLRIRHACNILNNPKANVNIANLAEQCGFKSKPSFYRNFKSITGMTPTEFQSLLKKNSFTASG